MKRTITLLSFILLTSSLFGQGEVSKPEKVSKKKKELPQDTVDSKIRYSLIGTVDVMFGFFQRTHYGLVEFSLINGVRFKRARVGIGISAMRDFYLSRYKYGVPMTIANFI